MTKDAAMPTARMAAVTGLVQRQGISTAGMVFSLVGFSALRLSVVGWLVGVGKVVNVGNPVRGLPGGVFSGCCSRDRG